MNACSTQTIKPETMPETSANIPYLIKDYYEITNVYLNDARIIDDNGNIRYSQYYTVYAWNINTLKTECIADDISVEYAHDNQWLITIGQKCINEYYSNREPCTGNLYPVDNWN